MGIWLGSIWGCFYFGLYAENYIKTKLSIANFTSSMAGCCYCVMLLWYMAYLRCNPLFFYALVLINSINSGVDTEPDHPTKLIQPNFTFYPVSSE